MKVKVKGYLTYKGSIGERTLQKSEAESFTLRELLVQLSLELDLGDAIYDPQVEKTTQRVAILINGRHYSHLPNGLDTALKDGDEVAIFPPIAGG